MTTTSIDVLTKDQKQAQREEIEKHVAEYLANGGKIIQCPRNAYTELDAEGKSKRKFSNLSTPDSLTDPSKRLIGGFVPPNKREN